VYKYPGGVQPLLNDLKVFRAAEMHLILAEAAADSGNFTDAGVLVNQLRGLRGADALDAPTSVQEAFGQILDERRLEFLFEGHRWVDLKRLGDRAGRTLDRDARECSFLSGCSLTNSDYRFTLPIPVSELTANGAADQNPGY
ncbi:MAG: RagB/SusD family nutrient uptake outer membrane protein, partial [Flavobacteriaceae bacterium]